MYFIYLEEVLFLFLVLLLNLDCRYFMCLVFILINILLIFYYKFYISYIDICFFIILNIFEIYVYFFDIILELK